MHCKRYASIIYFHVSPRGPCFFAFLHPLQVPVYLLSCILSGSLLLCLLASPQCFLFICFRASSRGLCFFACFHPLRGPVYFLRCISLGSLLLFCLHPLGIPIHLLPCIPLRFFFVFPYTSHGSLLAHQFLNITSSTSSPRMCAPKLLCSPRVARSPLTIAFCRLVLWDTQTSHAL